MSQQENQKSSVSAIVALAIGALGVVYGDIGTSPLYAVNEIFFGHAHLSRTPEHVLDVISLLLWSLIIIVSIKYIVFVLRADFKGEGGVFALISTLKQKIPQKSALLVTVLLFSAGLLYGDGIITPAISVLSAVEGLGFITSSLKPYIVPITIAILSVLFFIQKQGTAKVGSVFGPIIIVWFFSIGILGILQIIQTPAIFQALNPMYAIRLFFEVPIHEVLVLMGSVMLIVTGGEAMYSDMGHFGIKPIRLSWFSLVFPALLLNYLGQGALLLSPQPIIDSNIFYSMVPQIVLIPMVILATFATVIASQALISGAFSLTSQAVALGYFPIIPIKHTNDGHHGQIYIPLVNAMLYIGCVLLIISFRSSSNLAAAYGLAVSGDMVMTSLTMIMISYYVWKWNIVQSILLFGGLMAFESVFLVANSLKFFQGGWIPVTVAAVIFSVMSLWNWGKKLLSKSVKEVGKITVAELLELKYQPVGSVSHAGIFLSREKVVTPKDKIPAVLEAFCHRNGSIPRNVIMLTVEITEVPYLHSNKSEERYHVSIFKNDTDTGFIAGAIVRFGFMEDPNVEEILDDLVKHHELPIESDHKKWIIHMLHPRFLMKRSMNSKRKTLFRAFKYFWQNADHSDSHFGFGDKYNLSIDTVPFYVK